MHVSGPFQGAPAKESEIMHHLLLYSGGSMPETEEEQKTVTDACYSIISAHSLNAAVDLAKGCPMAPGRCHDHRVRDLRGHVRASR
jgi:hypothetical protein